MQNGSSKLLSRVKEYFYVTCHTFMLASAGAMRTLSDKPMGMVGPALIAAGDLSIAVAFLASSPLRLLLQYVMYCHIDYSIMTMAVHCCCCCCSFYV